MFASALQHTSHLVRVDTFAAFAPLIQGAGLRFATLPGDAEALLRSVTQGDVLFGRNPVERIRALACSLPGVAPALAAYLGLL